MKIQAPPRALSMLNYIHHYTDENGYPPTYREMADAIGVSSTETIYRYMKILRDQGAVEWLDHKSRTVKVTDDDFRW